MSTRKIVTNTIYYGVVPKLTMLLSIIILPLTTPFLTTYDYGINGVMASYTSLFISSRQGIINQAQRMDADNHEYRYGSNNIKI